MGSGLSYGGDLIPVSGFTPNPPTLSSNTNRERKVGISSSIRRERFSTGVLFQPWRPKTEDRGGGVAALRMSAVAQTAKTRENMRKMEQKWAFWGR